MGQRPASEFDKPLDTWIEEEVDIPSFEPIVNEKENRVEFKRTTKKTLQKTFYSEGRSIRAVCADHHYLPVGSKGNYIFACTKCDWNRVAPPVSFKYDQETGKLTRRHTGEQV